MKKMTNIFDIRTESKPLEVKDTSIVLIEEETK